MSPGPTGSTVECDPALPTCQPVGGDATFQSVLGLLIVAALAIGAVVVWQKTQASETEGPPAAEVAP